MKANQKFLKNDDDAVSPVIAVILMVAITVVLAATVYVWVSGFGSSANNSQQHTVSVVSSSALVGGTTYDIYNKTYTVSSADPTLTYGDMRISIDGTQYEFDEAGCTFAAGADSGDTVEWGACAGTSARLSTDLVKAGDTIKVSCYDTAANCLQDKGLIITDIEANSVMVTLTIR